MQKFHKIFVNTHYKFSLFKKSSSYVSVRNCTSKSVVRRAEKICLFNVPEKLKKLSIFVRPDILNLLLDQLKDLIHS